MALLLLVSAVAYVGNLDKTQEVFIIVGKETDVAIDGSFVRSVKLTQNEEVISINGGLSCEYDVDLSDNLIFYSEKEGKYTLTANILGSIPFKQITVNVVPEIYLYAAGDLIGVKMSTQGIIAVGFEDLTDSNGEVIASPAKKAGIQIGDVVTAVNGIEINTADEFRSNVQEIKGDVISLTVERGTEEITINVPVVYTADGSGKIGLWVRDKVAGAGTLTFITQDGAYFASLGHAVTDKTSGILVPLLNGEIVAAKAISVVRGEKGLPGEIKAIFENPNDALGIVTENTDYGIFGSLVEDYDLTGYTLYPIATQSEIKTGPATIITTLDDGKKEYEVYIEKVYAQSEPGTKSMLLRVTDEELLEKTGGIIQGMSGSPIIQNGKIVGAVTHVLVEDPTVGYGIFIEWMIKDFYVRQD